MGLVTSALQIGKSALLAYQSGLQVIGNNIANLGSDSYTRQTPVITPITGTYDGVSYQGGGGAAVSQIRRNIDEALNVRLRMSLGDQQATLAEYQSLTQLESVFNALGDVNLASQMNTFFNSWSSVQNTPEDQGARGIVLTNGMRLAESFSRTAGLLLNEFESLNKKIEQCVTEITEIGDKLAEVNAQIVQSEMGGSRVASTLRDQRDGLLADLSKLVAIQTREQPDGSMIVYIGNEPLVIAGVNRGLITERETVDGRQTVTVRWADNHRQITPWGGKLDGLLTARDTRVAGQIDHLDQLALALISDVNRLHATGQGQVGLTDVTGSYDVFDATAPLNTADNNLPYLPTNGGFLLTVTNTSTGEQTTVRIGVDLDGIGVDMSLTDLASAIDAVDDVTATVTADRRLRITTDAGYSFSFSDDTSGVLGALGINTFFSGKDAATITLDSNLVGQPGRLAAGMSDLPGDGSNAGRIAALATSPSSSLNNGQSLLDYYNAVMGDLATTTSAAQNASEAADVIYGSLQSQWESVSGVNLDEETLMLMRYQRAFQGAARIVAVVDELLREVLSMTR